MNPKEVAKQAQKIVTSFNREILELQRDHAVKIIFNNKYSDYGVIAIQSIEVVLPEKP